MFKKIKFILTPVLITTPLVSVISCSWNFNKNNDTSNTKKSKNEIDFKTFDFENIINKKASVKKVDVSKLIKRNITNYTGNISKQYNADYLVGGFAEERHIYGKVGAIKSGYSVYHLGDDIFMRAGTKILAPFKCEIVAAYWKRRPDYRPAEGLGGIVILKASVSDIPSSMLSQKDKDKYKIKSPNLYIGIGHLSKKTISSLTPKNKLVQSIDKSKRNVLINTFIDGKNTIKLSKGQPFAEVGIFKENGGWVPHIHVQIYRGGWKHKTKIRTENDFEYTWRGKVKLGQGWDSIIKKYIPNITGKKSPRFMGVVPTTFSKRSKNKETNKPEWHEQRYPVESALNRKGLLPPNILFHLYNKNTKVVTPE